MKSGNICVALGLGTVAALGIAATAALARELETSKEIIASQIRDQGYKCDKPAGAVRDTGASTPNETVWLLTCEDASYRVRLVPDMAARVERLPGNAATGPGNGTRP